MADGKVTIAVDLDGKKAQGDINSLKTSLSGLGSSFKSVLGANLVSGALMSGVNALASGVKGAFSSAMSEGAKLQQSIGGIETLFKGSAGTVKKYAEDAFRTAGISANEYMENVTSFSASLISSLGGDTAAAADLANTALMDMSDNANKMGSDMQVITQTYQSLARGNYAMLDNLKLGYGGTKAEMQRLIKDAASYKDVQEELNMTVDEGDLSFANMVKAISVVQKKLGITGTTAEEASKTFTGSFASMQAAFKDFLGNLTTGGDITKPLSNLAKTASTFIFRNFIPMVGNAFKSLPNAISEFLKSAKPEIEAGLKQLLPEETVNSIMKTFDNIGKFFSSFKDTGALTAVTGAFNAVKDAIGHVFSSLAGHEGTFTNIGTALGEIVKWLAETATKGAEFISSLPPGTIQTIASAVLGMVAAFKTVSTATKVISGLKTSFGLLKAALSNPWGLAIAGIGMLIGWFVHAYTTSETFRNKVNEIASAVGKVAGKIAEFVSGLDPSMFALIIPALGMLISKFKGFSSLSSLNPFKLFKKNATDAFTGAGGSATQSKGIIEQVFTGLGTLINSIAQGISTVLNGLATALSTVAQGFGQAASMASPAQWLSMGAAMLMVGAGVALAAAGIYVLVQAAIQLSSAGSGAAIALAGLAVGIAALAGIFALLGPALSAGAIGILAFGAAIALIGVGVYAASAGLSMLAGHLPMIATHGASAAIGIAALGAGLLVMGAGALVAGAGALVLGAGLLVAGAGATVFGAGMLVASAGVAAFGLALNVCKPGVTAFANAITKVVNAISGGLVAILNSISGVIQSVGNAALNAGKGFNQLATGVSKITKLNLFDMGASLAAVATGVAAIAASGAGLTSAGTGMTALGKGMQMVSLSATTAVAGLTGFVTCITTLGSSVTTLPITLTTAAAGFASFTAQAVAGVAGLSAINAPIAMFKSQIMTITPALMMAGLGFASFGAQAMVISVAFSTVSTLITAFNAQIMTVTATMMIASSYFTMISSSALMASSGIATISTVTSSLSSALSIAGSSATTFVNQMMMLGVGVSGAILSAVGAVTAGGAQMSVAMRSAGSQMVSVMQSSINQVTNTARNGMNNAMSAVRSGSSQMVSSWRSSGTQMVSSTQSFMNQIVSTVRNGMNNVVTAARSGGSQMVSAMRMAGNQLVTTVQSAVNQAVNAARNGYSSFQSAGSYMGQGLAVGMRSALGAVTAAANELVAQAERAAQAKAKIHSPSRLFRDAVGWWIGLGVAKGIDQSTVKVDDAISGMFDKINAFSFKAENVLGVGNSSISHSITTKVMREQAMRVTADDKKTQTDAYYIQNNNLLENLLDKVYDLEKMVEKGKQIVLDNGTLVGETKDYYDEAIGMNTAMKRRHQL